MSERLQILEKIEKGEITPEEGARQLSQLDHPSAESQDSQTESFNDMDILNLIEQGKLSMEDGLQHLRGSAQSEDESAGHADQPAAQISEEELERWKRWWQYPLYIGIALIVLSTLWINAIYQDAGMGFWFACAWLPFLLGLALTALSWRSRIGPWLHVRVRSKSGHGLERIGVSLPLPIGLSAWGLRTFGHHIPMLDNTSIDEVITALDQTAKTNSPFYVLVNDDEDGDEVEVFIG